MQVVNEQMFFPKHRKNLVQIRLVVLEKTQKMHTLITKNDVTEPKSRLL